MSVAISDLALWIDQQDRLDEIRKASSSALGRAYESGLGISSVGHQLDVFLFEPISDSYLGRLCSFSRCPKGRRDCLTPGCGAVPFNKVVADFVPRPDLLAPARYAMLYRRGSGRLRSALDLPAVETA